MIHQLARRFLVEQLSGVAVKEKIDAAHMNAEVICLGKKRTIDKATWNRLSADEYDRQ